MRARTWSLRHIACGLIATLATVTHAATAAPIAQDDDALTNAVVALTVLDGWVADMTLPAPENTTDWLTEPPAVLVQLRRGGEVLGRGMARADEGQMLRRAASRAFGEALGGLPRDAAAIDAFAKSCTVELEVAATLRPITGRSWDELAARLEPGVDGVALRKGDEWAIRFPSDLRITGVGALPSAGLELGVSPDDLEQLGRNLDLSIYRFETIHLVQRERRGVPVRLTRGDVLVSPSAASVDGARDLGRGLIGHLQRSMYPGDEALGLMGTYRPIADEYRPLVASPFEQGLVALALNRAAAHFGDSETSSVATEILNELAIQVGAEIDPTRDLASAAAIMLAILERPDGRLEPGELFARAAARVRASWHDGALVDRHTSNPDGATPPASTRALVGLALARGLDCDLLDLDRETVRTLLDSIWTTTPRNQHPALLPWITRAECLWAADGRVHERTRLDALRVVLQRTQVGPDGGDLAGGYNLSAGGASSKKPRPTGQSGRIVAGLAPLLTSAPDDESAEARRSLDLGIRYLVQLSCRPETTWAWSRPDRATGGIRASSWTADQPTAAQAIALLAAVEYLDAIERSTSK